MSLRDAGSGAAGLWAQLLGAVRSDATTSRILNGIVGVEASVVVLQAIPNNFMAKEWIIRWLARSRLVRRAAGLIPFAAVFMVHVLMRELDRAVPPPPGAGAGAGRAGTLAAASSSSAAVLAAAVAASSAVGSAASSAAGSAASAADRTARLHKASFGLLLLLFVHRTYYLTRNNAEALINLERSALERDMLEFSPSTTTLRLLSATYAAAAFRLVLLATKYFLSLVFY